MVGKYPLNALVKPPFSLFTKARNFLFSHKHPGCFAFTGRRDFQCATQHRFLFGALQGALPALGALQTTPLRQKVVGQLF